MRRSVTFFRDAHLGYLRSGISHNLAIVRYHCAWSVRRARYSQSIDLRRDEGKADKATGSIKICALPSVPTLSVRLASRKLTGTRRLVNAL